jgi:hypothetical protein
MASSVNRTLLDRRCARGDGVEADVELISSTSCMVEGDILWPGRFPPAARAGGAEAILNTGRNGASKRALSL